MKLGEATGRVARRNGDVHREVVDRSRFQRVAVRAGVARMEKLQRLSWDTWELLMQYVQAWKAHRRSRVRSLTGLLELVSSR